MATALTRSTAGQAELQSRISQRVVDPGRSVGLLGHGLMNVLTRRESDHPIANK